MAESIDNLEIYLNDVYEKECVFKIEKEEVDFIQRGVETLVQRLVEKILVYDPIWDEIEQDCVTLRSSGGKITRFQGELIKVGSFYEGTKNDFPSEFDLIYPFYFCEETDSMGSWHKEIIQRILRKTNHLISQQTWDLHKKDDKTDLCYASDDGMRKLYFDKFVGKTNPAMTMNFIYESRSGLHKEINVDLVPAAIIKDSNLGEIVDKYCAFEPFRKEVMLLGRVLMVDSRITFTETEVHIMRDMLSHNHRKIYRILKTLINGNGNSEAKADFSKNESIYLQTKSYSSYMIKTVIIYHHFICTKTDIEGLGPCILDVLKEMCKHKYNNTFPSLLKDPHTYNKTHRLFLLKHLQVMTNSLTLMQKSKESYEYERDRNKRSIFENFVYEINKYKTDYEEEVMAFLNL